MKKWFLLATILVSLSLCLHGAWAAEGDPILENSEGGISTPQSSTQAGYWRGYELSGNGSNYQAWESSNSITNTLTLKFSDDDPTNGQVMKFTAPSSNISTVSFEDDDDVPDAGDFGNAADLDANGNVTVATTSAQGKVELATAAETSTGTDTGRAVTPDGLAGSIYGEQSACFVLVESDTDVATGDGTIALAVPAKLNGMDLIDVLATVHTKGVTGTTDVQVRRRRAGSDVDMLSTKITIGDEWYATDEVINTSNDDVQTGDQLYCDIDAVHSGTAPKGLSVVLTFGLP